MTSVDTKKLFTYALLLGILTIVYNLTEGLISIYFGIADESLALFGFGIDSFIEVLSGLGVIVMILRIWRNPNTDRSAFEVTALRITGTAFYLLAVSLGLMAGLSFSTGHQPETTLPGIIISSISIVVMWALVYGKKKIGRALNSAPILADANCTLVCIYMSLVLLASSFIYELTGFGFIDILGAIGLIYFSVKEGKEAFEKAHGMACACVQENPA